MFNFLTPLTYSPSEIKCLPYLFIVSYLQSYVTSNDPPPRPKSCYNNSRHIVGTQNSNSIVNKFILWGKNVACHCKGISFLWMTDDIYSRAGRWKTVSEWILSFQESTRLIREHKLLACTNRAAKRWSWNTELKRLEMCGHILTGHVKLRDLNMVQVKMNSG